MQLKYEIAKYHKNQVFRFVARSVPDEPARYDVQSWSSSYVPAQSHIVTSIDSAESRKIGEPTNLMMSCLSRCFQSRAIAGCSNREKSVDTFRLEKTNK